MTGKNPAYTERLQPKNNRLAWVDISRGLTTIMVVMYHARLMDPATGQTHIICDQINNVLDALRMPTFIFISGGLLYHSRIAKGWETLSLYREKLVRLIVPFLFFVTVYFGVKLVLNRFVKTPVDCSLGYFLESFVIYPRHPSAHLWFLVTLSELMLCYPLFKWACQGWVKMAVCLALCVCFYFVDTSMLTEVLNIKHFNRHLVFFFGGIAFFRYRLYRYLTSLYTTIGLVALYVILYVSGCECFFLSSVVAVLGVCSLSIQLAKVAPKSFDFCSNYVMQIYLMALFFQAFVELVVWKRMLYHEQLFWFCYLLNIAAGVFMPIVVAKQVERCPIKWLRLCFGLSK